MGEHGLRMKIAPYDASYRSPLIVSHAGHGRRREVVQADAERPGPGRHVLRHSPG